MRRSTLVFSLLFGTAAFGRGVAQANNDPVPNSQTVNVPFATNQSFTLTATDVDGDPLTYTVISPPTSGSLTGTEPNLTYTPHPNYRGDDSLIFRVDDGNGGVASTWVKFNVQPPPPNAIYHIDGVYAGSSGVYGDDPVSLAGLAEGTHVLQVDATDAAGGSFSATLNFYIDNTPPTIEWRQHPGYVGQIIPVKGNIDMKVYVEDNRGVNPTDDHLSLVRLQPPTGSPVDFVRTATWGLYAKLNFDTRTQPDGLQTFSAYAADIAGNLTNPGTSYQTIIDNHAPTNVTMTISPSPVTINGDPVVHGSINISGSATDATSGMKNLRLYMKSGATDILINTFTGASFTNYAVNTALQSDGAWDFRVEAYDQVDNMAASTPQSLVLDNSSPNVQITTPANGATGIITLTEAQVNASDLHNISVRKLYLKQGAGSFIEQPMTYTGPNHWTLNTPLDIAGNYTLRAYAEDGIGNSGTNDVNLTLTGVNHPPTADAGPDQSVNERDLVSLAGSGTDVDGGALIYAWTQVSGPTVTLSNAGIANPTFTAPYVNSNQVVRLKLRVTDNQGAFAEDQIDVTIQNGSFSNQPPTANAGPDQTVNEQAVVSLAGSGSDPESGVITYSWSQVSGPSVTLSNSGIANPTFTAPYVNSNQVVRLKLRVTDDQGAFAEDLIDVTVQNGSFGNQPPTANAGPDQTVNEQALVSLAGSGTDPENGVITYSWSQVSGPAVTLSNAGIANPTFTAPYVNSNQVVRLKLRVTDDQGAFAEDLIDVNVQNGSFGNQPPTANAGPDQTVNEQALVSLAGSGTDPESGVITYSWTQVSGPTVTLSNSGIANPTFTAPYVNSNQVVRLKLRVTDDQGSFAEDLIDVTVQNGASGNQPPTANAGPDQTVNERDLVQLAGSGTDPESGVITYLWTQVSGPAVTLNANNISNPTFTAPFVNSNQVVRLKLRVTDDQGAFAEDQIDVTVQNGSFSNQPPTANAGPDQTVNEQAVVSLAGSGTDPESGVITYSWSQVSGPAVTLSNSGIANPTFTAPYVNSNQVVRLKLRVTDDQGAFAEDQIDVTVQNGASGNQPPTANAGPDQSVNEQAVVSLAGSGSDPEGGVITYLWTQVSGPAVTISANNIANPTFTAPFVNSNQVVRLKLRVTDDQGAFAEDQIDVTVQNGSFGNQPPTANAGPDQSVNEQALVSLAGSGTDPESGVITYSWSQVSGPAVTLSNSAIANPTFTAPYVNSNQVVRLKLRVTDDQGAYAEDLIDVTVQNGSFGNQPPTANAGPDQTVNEQAVVSLSGTGTDPEGGVLSYSWSQVSGPSVTLSNAGIANPTFTAPYVNSDQVVRLKLRVTDDQGAYAEDLIDVTVQNGSFGNQPPTANAGPDQTVNELTNVSLNGSGSDPESGVITYLWSQVSGPAVTFSANNIANPTFTAPSVSSNQIVHLKLRVTDDQGAFAEDLVDITVNDVGSGGNQPPTANAGPDQSVNENALVSLSGSGTDPEGGALTYAWSQVSGPSVTLSNAAIANPTFTSPYVNSNQVVRLKLRVTDDQGAFAEDLVDVTVQNGSFANQPPTANAGPDQSVNEQAVVSLSGSGTDPESGVITYSWSQVSGPSVTLSNSGVANPTFTAPFVNANQVVRLKLRVTDDQGAFAEDLIDVTVQNGSFGNQPPTANAGPDQSVNEQALVSLSGSGTDPESGVITYAWSQVSGPSVTLSNSGIANPTFTAPSVNSNQVVRLKLRVTDDQGAFGEDIVDITVIDSNGSGNAAPVISILSPSNNGYLKGVFSITSQATDDVAVATVSVKIDGGSEQLATLTGLHTYSFSWNSNAVGEVSHTIQAIAYDGPGLSASDSVTVIVDRTLPTVNTFTPADGATAQGTVSIQSTVADNRALVFAEILVDGTQVTSRNVSGTTTGISYSWDTLGLGEGTHQVTVHGIDAAGNERSVLHSVVVHNLGGGNPLPDFNIISPANNAWVGGTIITLHGKLTVGNSVTTGFTIDGGAFIPSTPPVGNVGDDFSTDIDPANPPAPYAPLADGAHVFEFVATTVDGTTRKSITLNVDTTKPTIVINNPAVNGTIFLVDNLLAQVSDANNNPIDEVQFEINGTSIALRLGNADPLDTAYSFQLDTQAENLDGTPKWPDSPPGVYNYTLTVTAWDKARNKQIAIRPFRIDNANIPPSLNAVLNFQPVGFTAGPNLPSNVVKVDVVNATIDATSFNNQGQHALSVKVKTNSSSTWSTWTGPLRLVGNSIFFDRALPVNSRFQLAVRVMDTNNKLIQGSVEGIMAMRVEDGGSVSSADGWFTMTIPPNTLQRNMYLELPVMTVRPQWMQEADLSFSQLYSGHQVVAGPYQVDGFVSMVGSAIHNEPLSGPASVSHSISLGQIPPTQQSLLRQIQEVRQTAETNFWHPLGTSSNEATQNASFRSVSGTTHILGVYRVTMFAAPGSGITEVFNYSNPFHPDEGPTTITYMLGDNADVTLTIFDALGNFVKRNDYAAGAPGGTQGVNAIPWDGRNGKGDLVASGSYIAQLLVKDVNGGHFKARRKIGVVR